MPVNIDDIAREDLGEDSVSYRIYMDIREWIQKDQNINLVTYKNISDHISVSDSSEMYKVVEYLCGNRVHFFDMHFEYIDHNDEVFILDYDQVAYAKDNDEIYHPLTSEKVSDVRKDIFVSFKINKKLLDG